MNTGNTNSSIFFYIFSHNTLNTLSLSLSFILAILSLPIHQHGSHNIHDSSIYYTNSYIFRTYASHPHIRYGSPASIGGSKGPPTRSPPETSLG